MPYRNPLRDVNGLSPERIDMGVDYQGAGPVYALGPGVVTAANLSWAGGAGAVGPGTWITYRLTAGPLAGHSIYVAENVVAMVRPGDTVDSSTVVGVMTGQGAGIETGFAADGPQGEQGVTLAAAMSQQAPGQDPGAWPTAAGAAFDSIVRALGGPPAMSSGGPHGANPAWLALATAGLPGWVPGAVASFGQAFALQPGAGASVAARALLVVLLAAGAAVAVAGVVAFAASGAALAAASAAGRKTRADF